MNINITDKVVRKFGHLSPGDIFSSLEIEAGSVASALRSCYLKLDTDVGYNVVNLKNNKLLIVDSTISVFLWEHELRLTPGPGWTL